MVVCHVAMVAWSASNMQYEYVQRGVTVCTCVFSGAQTHAASSSKKPRSRSIFHSLFCCLCHDETEQLPVNNNAPLLVEENGTVSKVRQFCCTSVFLNTHTFFPPSVSLVRHLPHGFVGIRG